MDEASCNITWFATHKGLKRYKRLTFGTGSAVEIFQNVIQTIFQDIEGCINISDDILIFAKTQHEHDMISESVFKCAEANNGANGFIWSYALCIQVHIDQSISTNRQTSWCARVMRFPPQYSCSNWFAVDINSGLQTLQIELPNLLLIRFKVFFIKIQTCHSLCILLSGDISVNPGLIGNLNN